MKIPNKILSLLNIVIFFNASPVSYQEADLHRAAYKGNISIIRSLISNNVNLNAENFYGWTALHLATYKGHIEIIKMLIDANADLNIQARNSKWTALHIAVLQGNTAITKLLIAVGANLNIRDAQGWTPLNIASADNNFMNDGKRRIFKMLIKAGANKEVRDIKHYFCNSTILNVLSHYFVTGAAVLLNLAVLHYTSWGNKLFTPVAH